MSGKDRRHSDENGGSRPGPTRDQIAERAYARYEARRRSSDEDRSPEEDWYEAERELREAADTPSIEPEETSIYAAPPHPPRSEIATARSGRAEERRSQAEDEDSETAESFSPRPESAEKTHAETPRREEVPPSFSPRPESAKTTRAPRTTTQRGGKGRAAKKG